MEWGVSGAAASGPGVMGGTGRGGKRRAYHQLRAAIDAGQVSALYAYSLSRLARSTRELLDLAEACVAQDVPIRLAKEGDIDGTTPTGRLYLTVLAGVATFEAEVSRERAHDRNEAMRDGNRYLGRAPYGYLIDDGRLIPDPAAAQTLRRVLTLHARLKSPARVALALNEAGVPAPQGGLWRDGTIRRIIARQPGYKPPATVKGSRAVPAARFSRLLFCWCGAMMSPDRKSYRTVRGEPRSWVGYGCQRGRVDPKHGKPYNVPESAVLEVAKAEAARLRLPELVEIANRAEERRADLDARRGRVIDALEAGTITRAEAQPRLDRIAADLEALAATTEVLDVPQIDWSWPAETLNPVLRSLWDRIELDHDMQPTPAGFSWRVPEWRNPA